MVAKDTLINIYWTAFIACHFVSVSLSESCVFEMFLYYFSIGLFIGQYLFIHNVHSLLWYAYHEKVHNDIFVLTAPLIRPPLARNSSVCRSRRSLLSQPSNLSADPDLLSMASAPLAYRPEGDDDHIFFTVERKGYDIYSFSFFNLFFCISY